MSNTAYQCFELLKDTILETAGIHTPSAGDCGYLSGLIYSKTKKSVSETTLKRIYGFASSRFKPSGFTLNALCQYCGFQTWDEFCKQKAPATRAYIEPHEKNLFERADRLTKNTIQALQNRSGIPFYHTINRKEIYNHLSIFENEDYAATFIVGPSGAGKTIGLLHWIKEKIAYNSVISNNDVYLFFSSYLLNTSMLHENSLEKWILNLFGIEGNVDIARHFSENQLKLFLIVDGFEEHFFKPDQFEKLYNQLIDLVSIHKDNSWLKLIVTVSSATWLNGVSRIKKYPLIQDKIYFGNWQSSDQGEYNIAPFSYNELALLAEKINPKEDVPAELREDILHFLGNPEYFTYFYSATRHNFSLSHAKSAYIYSLLSNSILDKVYSGKARSEKMAVIEAITANMSRQENTAYTIRNIIHRTIRSYSQAYRELLNTSIISEMNKSNTFQYKELIRFANNHIARYFFAEKMLREHDDKISYQLIHDAQFITFGEDDSYGVLKWLICHAVKKRDFKIFEYLCGLKIHPAEKATLLTFICDHLNEHHNELYDDSAFNDFLKNDFVFFNTFFKLQFISPEYKAGIGQLLRFDLSDEKKVLVRSILAFCSLAEADILSVSVHILEIQKLSEGFLNTLPLNPADGMMAIVRYFKQEKIDKSVFKQMTTLLFNPIKITAGKYLFEVYLQISTYIILLNRNSRKTNRFIKLIRHDLPKHSIPASTEFNLWLSMVECKSAILNNKFELAESLFIFLSNRFQSQHENYTEMMRLSFLMLKIQAVVYLKKPDDPMHIEKQINRLTEKLGYVTFDMMNKSFILSLGETGMLTSDETRSAKNSLVKQAHSKGLRYESFEDLYKNYLPPHKFMSQA